MKEKKEGEMLKKREEATSVTIQVNNERDRSFICIR